jgi:Uma2 family endonuclease
MTALLSERRCIREEAIKWVWPRPLTFLEFLDLFSAEDNVELVDGVAVEREMVQLDHEKLLGWLYHLMALYAEEKRLGIVLGSRTPVHINPYRGRLPDLLFVRQDRLDMVQQKAVFGAPDLVIEIVSPGDRPSDLTALETDYRNIGVSEIVFIDPPKRNVRILRQDAQGYTETAQSTGPLRLAALPGFEIETEWLFTEPRPSVRALLDKLLGDDSASM